MVLSCNCCGGLGVVPVEAADRYLMGRALRDQRVKAGLSLAEGAALRGFTVFEKKRDREPAFEDTSAAA